MRHLDELLGGAEGLLVAVSFKKTTEGYFVIIAHSTSQANHNSSSLPALSDFI